jgi:hypothetical protein
MLNSKIIRVHSVRELSGETYCSVSDPSQGRDSMNKTGATTCSSYLFCKNPDAKTDISVWHAFNKTEGLRCTALLTDRVPVRVSGSHKYNYTH